MIIETIVENKIQFDYLLKKEDIDTIIISIDCFLYNDIVDMVQKINGVRKNACIRLERISRFEEDHNKDNRLIKDDTLYDYRKILGIDGISGVLVQNIDSFYKVMECVKKGNDKYKNLQIELDYTMNVYNKETKRILDDYYEKIIFGNKNNVNSILPKKLKYTYPIELSIKDIKDLSMDTLVVYSYIPVMVSANCINKTYGKCECNNTRFMKDRKGEKIYCKSYCKYCYSKIFNPDVYYIADNLSDINKEISYDKIRYDFTICNNTSEMDKVFNDISPDKKYQSFTRGHIKKSIE